MKIGVCTVVDKVLCFKDVADYVELRLTQIAQMTDGQFEELKKLLVENEISVEATNFFLPGNVKICGPDMSVDTVKEYVDGALKRASELGVGICVLGSGGARRIPENMSFEDMMARFKAISDEKMTDLKRASGSKRGSAGYSRRGAK